MMSSLTGPGRFTSNGIRIPLPLAVNVTSWIMLIGFSLSIILAVLYNFEHTTETHCRVANYLPSFSAAIATPPSSYVWRLAVALCSSQRLTAVFGHYSVFSSLVKATPFYRLLCGLCAVLEMAENVSLLGLTCISSSEYYKAHEFFFVSFQASNMLYMLCICLLYYQAVHHGARPTKEENHILTKKLALIVINILAFICAVYFFFRHNWYCEAGVYSLFAGCEYVVVLTNIAFHQTVSSYFTDRELRLGCRVKNER
ncbi:post-GPI attachment to proteins factor 2-like [Diadema setosum]|uniref:post-GPI attachment to proteins factor 2-like n=1 Tax=Diadema setosum TaxID=31175 RepID=UPI003B3B3475